MSTRAQSAAFPGSLAWAVGLLWLSASPAYANTEILGQICAANGWNPNYTQETAKADCEKAGDGKSLCLQLKSNMFTWNEEYKALSQAACVNSRTAMGKVTDINQAAGAKAAKESFLQARQAMNQLISKNEELTKKLPAESMKNVTHLNRPAATSLSAISGLDNAAIRKAKRVFEGAQKDPQYVRKEKVDPKDVDSAKDSKVKAQLEALERSSDFIVTLLTDKEAHEKAAAELQGFADNMAKLEQSLAPPASTPTPPPGQSGGFDPSSLAALAGPAAGLASAAMQRQNQSGISDPGLIAPPPNPVPNPPAAKLGTNSNSKGPGSVEPPAEAKEDPAAPSSFPGGFSAFASDSESGISTGPSDSLTGAGSPVGFSGGGGKFTPGNASGGEPDKEETSRSVGSTDQPPDEALQGFGGAGGLNFSGSSSSSHVDTEESGPMREILQDMESAIEGEDTGLFADDSEESAEEGLGIVSGDALFPRVRACYLRALKRGNILNGLGERDSEIEN